MTAAHTSHSNKSGTERCIARREYELAHSTVILEETPAGVAARIEHEQRGVEYAQLDDETVEALREVAR